MPLGATNKFGVIYFMVLIGFSQLLYLSTNKQNTGMATFIQRLSADSTPRSSKVTSGFSVSSRAWIVDLALNVSGRTSVF